MLQPEWILNRISSSQEEIIVNKRYLHCGRVQEMDLKCFGELVSKEHCIFISRLEDLYVKDLSSAKGVYVNEKRIEPNKEILLKENDYIGIGCPEITTLDLSKFVYKLKSRRFRVISGNDEFKNSITKKGLLDCYVIMKPL